MQKRIGCPKRPTALAVVAVLGLGGAQSGCGDEQTSSPRLRSEPTLERLSHEVPGVRIARHRGRITRLYGKTLATGVSPEDSVESFLTEHAAVFDVSRIDLRPQLAGGRIGAPGQSPYRQPLMYDRATGRYKFWLLKYHQSSHDLPVFRAEVRLLVGNRAGSPLTLAVSSLQDLTGFTPRFAVGGRNPARAVLTAATRTPYRARASAAAGAPLSSFTQPRAVVWAGIDQPAPATEAVVFEGDNLDQRQVIPLRFRFVANAATGEILYKEPLIHTDVSGTVHGMHTPGIDAMECTDEESAPLPYALVTTNTGLQAYTDGLGNFSIADDSGVDLTLTSTLQGLYFHVVSDAGGAASLSEVVAPGGAATFLHNESNTSATLRAQINGYAYANQIRDWVLAFHPDYPVIATEDDFEIRVNRDDFYCPGNAWYDDTVPSLNFCQAGSAGGESFANTAFGAITYHEYGHHVVDSGGAGQWEYGEGIADSVAALYADNSDMGVGFYLDQCSSPLRTTDNDCTYDESNCSSCGWESHDCGQLLSGAIWEVRKELGLVEPADALEIAANLTVNSILLHTGGQITPQIAIDLLTLDDDDGNLDNSTPHREPICAGLGAHGLDCPALGNLLTLTLPTDVTEDAGLLAGQGQISVSLAPTDDQLVELSSDDESAVQVPSTVTIAAGATSATFDLTVVDDALLDGTRVVAIDATSDSAAPGTGEIRVHDDETASITLQIPANASEGDGLLAGQGLVTISAPVGADVAVALQSSDEAELLVPPFVTVPTGATTAVFDLDVVDDDEIDGPKTTDVTASVVNWQSGTDSIEIADNEVKALSLTVPSSAREGAGTLAGAGRASISGRLADDLTVQLTSSNTDVVEVPATVIIPAGTTGMTFDITLADDSLPEANVSATITAEAADFTPDDAVIEVRDDDVDHFVLSAIASPQLAGEAFSVQIDGVDGDGNAVADFERSVSLTVTGDAGAHPVAPANIELHAGSWSGEVAVQAVDTNVRLQAFDGEGHAGTSVAFDVDHGPLHHFITGPVDSLVVSGQPVPITVEAVDAHGYTVTGYTDAAAIASRVGPTRLLITEVSTGDPDFVEIQNVSTHDLDTAGWSLVVSSSTTDPNAVGFTPWDLPTQIGAGDVTYRTDDPSDNYWGGTITWEENAPGWAMILNAEGKIEDLVIWGWPAATVAGMAPIVAGNAIPVASAFSGSGVSSAGFGSIQRRGFEDRDSAADFGWRPATKGTQNPTLEMPFMQGVLAVLPAQTGAFAEGSWSGEITLIGETSATSLLMSHGADHSGMSNTFALTLAPACVSEPCQNGGFCLPTGDSYQCDCGDAFQGPNCETDVDECAAGTHDCDANATCSNTFGGFECDCIPGYSGDGASCEVVCGDGRVGPEEECDQGEQNSDTEPNACRTTCEDPHCGDGVIDDGETCDDGDENSDEVEGACRSWCALPTCGDGLVDDGEQCDDGDENSDTAANACRESCAEAFCGDGVTDDGEECDDGQQNGDGDSCSSSCEKKGGGCNASGSGAEVESLLMLLCITLLVSRRRRRTRA